MQGMSMHGIEGGPPSLPGLLPATVSMPSNGPTLATLLAWARSSCTDWSPSRAPTAMRGCRGANDRCVEGACGEAGAPEARWRVMRGWSSGGWAEHVNGTWDFQPRPRHATERARMVCTEQDIRPEVSQARHA